MIGPSAHILHDNKRYSSLKHSGRETTSKSRKRSKGGNVGGSNTQSRLQSAIHQNRGVSSNGTT